MNLSSVHLADAWFIGCLSGELKSAPLARTIQGTPLVLFRGEGGRPAALLDRCPHRNVPLSMGKVVGGQLQCGYHGWRFQSDGACAAIPGLVGESQAKARNAQAYATLEQDGFVWVYASPGVEPKGLPYRFPLLDDPRYTTVRRQLRAEATMHAVIENTLDVPHTAFLHGGLFRTARKEHEIEVVVRRTADRVEAEFVGEPRPPGLAGRLLAPGGGVVIHFDRFLLPSIAQVEYQLGKKSHLITTTAMTPVTELDTRIYAVVTLRLPLPGWLVRPFLTPIALGIFKQDARVLALQSQTLRKFGGEQYASTELDVLGPQVWRLLKQAASAEAPAAEAYEKRIKMRV